MGRPRRRAPDIDLDGSYQPHASQYNRPAAAPYDDPYPPRGRSPGPRRRHRSEPAAAPVASYDDNPREHALKKDLRESRRHRKERKDTVLDEHIAPVDTKRDRKVPNERYHDNHGEALPGRARSHGPSSGDLYRATNDREDFDTYAPASRRGRERQHAYHPPRTSETRRAKYPDYDPEMRPSTARRSRYADYDPEPRISDRRRSRHADYDDAVPRSTGASYRPRHSDYQTDPRRRSTEHAAPGRGNGYNDSPGRFVQPGQERSARGRSVPRNPAVRGAAQGARPRAKSAVGYAALGEAAQTAFRVGSQAAYQMRNEPGPWIGEKGTKVATAALGAALVDTFVGHKASGMKGGMRHQALRQACEMGIRNFVMQPAVNSANNYGGSGGGSGRRRR
ncbi:hypothetical protein CKAH01_14360 [Colletotrichum kahawae]|uniref:Uncharacterized protein n=1 Tax=Colletotrichum kahawae TaxID=34407 RepID=A0AAD9YLZ4_COLKA|nr:hypothetical protein CKAH01_14360 [Colletotrichum kahawae]